MGMSDYVVMIVPKALLNTPEFTVTRRLLAEKKVDCIQDFGEKGFQGVLGRDHMPVSLTPEGSR